MGPAGRTVEALGSKRRIGIDTPVFIHHIQQASPQAAAATTVLRAVEDGRFDGITSGITLLEVTVQPLRLGHPEIADAYEALLGGIPNLSIVTIDSSATRTAAELRAAYQLRTPEALQIAACLVHGAETFITNDRRLRRVTEIDITPLDEFA